MLKKYLICFFISMVPLIEVRGGMPFAIGMGLDKLPALIVCTIGNMLPVPVIYFLARKVLFWGARKKFIGKPFSFFLRKGKQAGKKLTEKAGKKGLFVALMLFVGIPIPGTGAWTGTLAASFLNMGIKNTSIAVCCGVLIASVIMSATSLGIIHIFGL